MTKDSKEANIEIYRQRYETYRHLDKLRWQMLQILIAISSLFVVLLRLNEGKIECLFLGIAGIIMMLLSYTMFRIGEGIRNNGIVLDEFGKKIGDTAIPDVSNKLKASSHLIAIFVFLIGVFLLGVSVINTLWV